MELSFYPLPGENKYCVLLRNDGHCDEASAPTLMRVCMQCSLFGEVHGPLQGSRECSHSPQR